MSDHPDSTTAPKSIGELSKNIVDTKQIELRRLCWKVADLLNEAMDPRFEYVTIRSAKQAGKAAVYMGFDISPNGESIAELFQQWVSVRDAIREELDIEQATSRYDRYVELQAKITSMEPATARDLSMMLYVETDSGLSDYRDEFASRIFALCEMKNLNVAEGDRT